ncbi:hypothetical protein ElyMa_002185100 [Elysia marginata]|uniref:DUF6046 domain-containing protein n=1 Tax=Elysia marginata TaxID=1093978 RepID=A0AAV4FRE0_9GAST|nr:hypothetical protein ElyMa_002185100 [Elysia marginata]
MPGNPLNAVKGFIGQYSRKNTLGIHNIVPMSLYSMDGSDSWDIPVEVMVRVQGKQKIIRRHTYHPTNKGSVKEQWGLDDYQLQIRGVFFLEDSKANATGLHTILQGQIKRLNDFFEVAMVQVNCPLLTLFGIQHMCIESIHFPFSKEGLEVIPWEVKAYSDFRQEELLTAV